MPDSTRPPSSTVSHTALLFFALVIIANTLYVTNISQKNDSVSDSTAGLSIRKEPAVASSRVPEVVIFRRTKKTGSTSVLETLLKSLISEGYTALYNESTVLSDIVRAEFYKASPGKLFIGSHNGISRAHTGSRSTVIVDTVADGYKQMTSFCRYVREVEDCDSDEMRECLRSAASRYQLRYRWTGREMEDSETFIDLPLSAAHPALSATVFRRAFPHITLDIAQNNVKGSSCEDIANIRKIYDEFYSDLDEQVLRLRKRILTLAGYPSAMIGYSVVELLDAAEKTEQANYKLEKHKPTAHNGDFHVNVKGASKSGAWYISEDGKLLMKDKQS